MINRGWMDEQRRMRYLDAMGIDSFVPRFQLAVAKPSQRCVLPVLPSIEDASPTITPASDPTRTSEQTSITRSSGARPASDPLSRETTSESTTGDAAHTEVLADKPSQKELDREPSSEAAPAFSLAVWRTPSVLVIDSHRSGGALPTPALLTNILCSFAFVERELPKAEILKWPMTNRERDKSWTAAAQLVQGFLDARLLQDPVQDLLLFGDNAGRAVLGDGYDSALHRFQRVPLMAYSASATVLPSLAEILYDARLKRRVWQTITAFFDTRVV